MMKIYSICVKPKNIFPQLMFLCILQIKIAEFANIPAVDKINMIDRYGLPLTTFSNANKMPDLDYQNTDPLKNTKNKILEPEVLTWKWNPYSNQEFRIEDERRQLQELSNFNSELEADLKKSLNTPMDQVNVEERDAADYDDDMDEDYSEFKKKITDNIRAKIAAIKEQVKREVSFGLLDSRVDSKSEHNGVNEARKDSTVHEDKQDDSRFMKSNDDKKDDEYYDSANYKDPVVYYDENIDLPALENAPENEYYNQKRKDDDKQYVEHEETGSREQSDNDGSRYNSNKMNLKTQDKRKKKTIPYKKLEYENVEKREIDPGLQEILETMHSIRKREAFMRNSLARKKRQKDSTDDKLYNEESDKTISQQATNLEDKSKVQLAKVNK